MTRPDLIGTRPICYNIIWNWFWENLFNSLYSKSLATSKTSSNSKDKFLRMDLSKHKVKLESNGFIT